MIRTGFRVGIPGICRSAAGPGKPSGLEIVAQMGQGPCGGIVLGSGIWAEEAEEALGYSVLVRYKEPGTVLFLGELSLSKFGVVNTWYSESFKCLGPKEDALQHGSS